MMPFKLALSSKKKQMLCPVPNPEPQKKENKENSANDAVLLLPFPFNFKPTEIILKVLSYL